MVKTVIDRRSLIFFYLSAPPLSSPPPTLIWSRPSNLHQDFCSLSWLFCWDYFCLPTQRSWARRALSQDQMDRGMKTSAALIKMVQDKGRIVSRTKQMVFLFRQFGCYLQKPHFQGTTMHANYIIGGLLKFMKAPGRKILIWCPGRRCSLGQWSSAHHAETSEVSSQEDI
jgi:hypothetical protein